MRRPGGERSSGYGDGRSGERPGSAAPGTDLPGRAVFPALPARTTRDDGAEDVRVTVTAEVAGGHSGGGAWLPGGRWSAPSRLDEVILGLAPGDLPSSPPRRSQRQRAWEPLAEATGPVAAAAAAAPGAMRAAGGEGSLPAAAAPSTGRFSAAAPAWGEHVNGINGSGGHGDTRGGGWLSDGRENGDESGGEPLPARVVELLVRVCGTQGQAAQEAAADELRELVHDSGTADSLSRERCAARPPARPPARSRRRGARACRMDDSGTRVPAGSGRQCSSLSAADMGARQCRNCHRDLACSQLPRNCEHIL